MVTSVPQLPISGHNATEDYKTKVLVAFWIDAQLATFNLFRNQWINLENLKIN